MGDISLTDAEFIYSAPNVCMSGSVLSSGNILYPDPPIILLVPEVVPSDSIL